MKRLSLRAAACATLVLAAGLAGCVPAALVGGAVGAGALLMTADRRSGETQEADRTIEAAAGDAVVRALPGRGHVNITSYYRKVLITGEVPSAQDSQLVAAQVRAVPGVAGVVNELAVMPESSTLQRSNDGLITSKVRTRLMNQNGVPAGSIRVTTERGTTYLMGRLTATETALATEVARQTDGVQRVVRVIDLIADPAGGSSVTTHAAPVADPAVSGTAAPTLPAAGDQATGVVVSPVTQPVIEQPRPPVQVQTLPPMK
ncbi:MAG: BON domain-containing protein [Ottowia sp.]|nr:BON domain-containing protein [Ottowia sp.]MBP7532498.1 BON domain-containing protein [Ottowia sp.]MBP7535762.1 BON domain-containing protein [Ottowia sp.]